VKFSVHAARLLSAARAALTPRPAPRDVARVLVLGYGAIGDTLFFLPILEVLRRAYPRAHVVWLSNPYPTTDELIPALGLVDEVWKWDAAEEDAAVNARIRDGRFDLAVMTLATPAPRFVCALREIPVVAGHRLPWRGLRSWAALGDYARAAVVNRPAPVLPGEHALARNARLLDALTLPPPSSARPALPLPAAARARAAERLSGLPGPVVAVHLGPVGNPYGKMWAPDKFAALTGRLRAAWGGSIVLLGSAEEASAAKIFAASGATAALSLVGETGLLETFAVLEKCALLIASDTGLTKAAAALGVPTATLWGPSDPAEFRAPWEPEKHLDLRTGISCSPCSWLGTPARSYNYMNCGTRDCLAKLEVETVANALLRRWPRLEKSGARA